MVISSEIDAVFHKMSGVTSGKKQLLEIVTEAQMQRQYGRQTIVFLDEIHRWSKAQQDTLLPYVEDGTITLIGATTENPSFTIINALLSRCSVIVFEAHSVEDVVAFFSQSRDEIARRFPWVTYGEEELQWIAARSDGDIRRACSLLEATAMHIGEWAITIALLEETSSKAIYYDRDGDDHYNIISAVHKSLRDSDPDAAVYWVQRMLVGGEDPLYIARRLLRFASEDVWLANNNALLLANTVYETVQKLGMPECDTALMQLTIYLAQCKKSNTTYTASKKSRADIEKHGNLPVPMVIRNAPTHMMQEMGYGDGYIYAHDDPAGASAQQHLPDDLVGRRYV